MSDSGKMMCCERVYNRFSFSGRTCTRAAKVERDGKHYCGQHDPVEVKRRLDESHALRVREAEARNYARAYQIKLNEFGVAAADAIRQIAEGHNDPAALAREVMALKPSRSST